MRFWRICLFFALISAGGCKGPLPLIGLDKKSGKTITYDLSEEKYRESLQDVAHSVSETVEESMGGPHKERRKWELQLISVGFALRSEIGFGPFKAGAVPGVRLFFTNAENPPPLP